MRVLLTTDYYAPFVGGAERQAGLLAHELNRRGHDCEVVTLWGHGLPEVEDDDGVRVNRIRQVRTCAPRFVREPKQHATPFPDPVMAMSIRRAVRRFRPDVVHTYGWISYSSAAALLGIPTPLVVSARDYAYGCVTRTLVHRGSVCSGPQFNKCMACSSDYFGRARGSIGTLGSTYLAWPLLRRKVAGLHSVSTYVQSVVRRDFVDDRKLGIPHVVIPSFTVPPRRAPSADTAAPTSAAAQLPDRPFILFVGELRTEKGLDLLLRAYAGMPEPRPPLVAIGPFAGHDLGPIPPGALILGPLPHAEIMRAWHRCLFGVAPSRLPEPFGSVVFEAMSAGKAMIGTAPGGHADMIDDGRSGLLVPAGNADALFDALILLAGDADLRDTLGRAARLRARDFLADKTIPAFLDLYTTAIARPR